MRILPIALLLPLLCVFPACGKKKSDLSPDFSTRVLNEGDVAWDRPTDCRAHIKQATCIVSAQNRNCTGDNSPYVRMFETLYDSYPAGLQKMFCSLRHIYIESETYGTAYAQNLVRSDGTPAPGANVGFRKSILDAGLGFATWASWKEQLSFGGARDSYVPVGHLPRYEISGADNLQLFLFYVTAHEFGHLFDYANNVNSRTNGVTAWNSLSWTGEAPNAANAVDGWAKFCFYGCESYAGASDVNPLYVSLERTNFLTAYASTNPWDDFAESVAYYFAEQNLQNSVWLDTAQGMQVEVSEKLTQPVFADKRRYLETFFQQANLLYP